MVKIPAREINLCRDITITTTRRKESAGPFFLNLGFTVIEFIGGSLTNSTAIMADAVHDLGDSLSIRMAWLLNKLSGKDADERFT